MKFSLDTIRAAKGFTVDEISERYNIPVEKIKEFSEDPGSMPASMVILWRQVYGIPIDYIQI